MPSALRYTKLGEMTGVKCTAKNRVMNICTLPLLETKHTCRNICPLYNRGVTCCLIIYTYFYCFYAISVQAVESFNPAAYKLARLSIQMDIRWSYVIRVWVPEHYNDTIKAFQRRPPLRDITELVSERYADGQIFTQT